MKIFRVFAIVAIFLIVPALVCAQQIDPKSYVPLKPDTNLAIMYARWIDGTGKYVGGDQVDKTTHYSQNFGMFRYLYYNKIKEMPFTVNVLAPFGNKTLESGAFKQSASGYGDPTLMFALWPISKPGKFHFGVTQYITFPLGAYESDKAVNMGDNRYAFREEIGMDYTMGKWQFQTIANAIFYTDNNEYSAKALTSEKAPLYYGQFGILYNLTDKFYVGADLTYTEGGRTTVNGIKQEDTCRTWSSFVTAAVRVTPEFSIAAQYGHDISVYNGIPMDSIRLRFGYAF